MQQLNAEHCAWPVSLKFFGFYQHIAHIHEYGYGNNEQSSHIFSKNLMDLKNR